MDQEPDRSKSFSRESSGGSSLSLSRSLPLQINNDVDSESVSEAGDIGDRSLRRRHSAGRSSRLSVDDLIEQGTNDTSGQEHDVLHDLRALNTTSVVKPLPENITASPLQTKSLLSPATNKLVERPSLTSYNHIKTVCVGFLVSMFLMYDSSWFA